MAQLSNQNLKPIYLYNYFIFNLEYKNLHTSLIRFFLIQIMCALHMSTYQYFCVSYGLIVGENMPPHK